MSNQLFSVSGIVTDANNRSKVRYCNDLVGRVKLFTKNTGNKRVDLIELPNPMSKIDAIKFLQSHPNFSSTEDQILLSDTLMTKEPKQAKTARVRKTTSVKTTTQNKPSLANIRSRMRKVTAEDILATVAATAETNE